MKRVLSLLLAVVFVLSLSTAAFAASVSLSYTASVDNATKQVTISGSISSGAGKMITVRVINPSNGVDYLNQAASGPNGAFSFQYYLDENVSGTYSVFVKGAGMDAPIEKSFQYTEQGGTVPSVDTDPKPVTATIDEKYDVKIFGNAENGANKTVTVKVYSATKIVYLNQTTTRQNGAYSFAFNLASELDGLYTVVVSGPAFDAQQVTTFIKGKTEQDPLDVNGDGKVDYGDVSEAMKYFNWSSDADYSKFDCGCTANCYHEYDGKSGLSWGDAQHADVNGDGIIDIADLTAIINAIE